MSVKSNTIPSHDTGLMTSVAIHNAKVQQPLTTVSPNSISIIVMLHAEERFVSKHNVVPFRCPCLPFIAPLGAKMSVVSSQGENDMANAFWVSVGNNISKRWNTTENDGSKNQSSADSAIRLPNTSIPNSNAADITEYFLDRGLMQLNLTSSKSFQGVVACGGGHLRCRLHHLTDDQNYEVHMRTGRVGGQTLILDYESNPSFLSPD
ncbi:hypothetical protein TNCV_4639731 [Trichonephila clavipes]|nr:hypothetical protein TNCV_4639731 [Trichonephila clavipes]